MRLELEEVEAVLAAHPAVRHAAVAVRRNAAGASHLVGYVIAPVTTPGDADFLGWCAGGGGDPLTRVHPRAVAAP